MEKVSDAEYQAQLNKYKDRYVVWRHSDRNAVIGTQDKFITPYTDSGAYLGFYVNAVGKERIGTIKRALIRAGATITQNAQTECCGKFPAENLDKIAKVLKIKKKRQKAAK